MSFWILSIIRCLKTGWWMMSMLSVLGRCVGKLGNRWSLSSEHVSYVETVILHDDGDKPEFWDMFMWLHGIFSYFLMIYWCKKFTPSFYAPLPGCLSHQTVLLLTPLRNRNTCDTSHGTIYYSLVQWSIGLLPLTGQHKLFSWSKCFPPMYQGLYISMINAAVARYSLQHPPKTRVKKLRRLPCMFTTIFVQIYIIFSI